MSDPFRQLLKDTIRGGLLDGDHISVPAPHGDERIGALEDLSEDVLIIYDACVLEVIHEQLEIGLTHAAALFAYVKERGGKMTIPAGYKLNPALTKWMFGAVDVTTH